MSNSEPNAAGSSRILVVEDERLIAAGLQATLRRVGYEVAGRARTGDEAIRLSGELHPNLVLMDIGLAGEMDGIEAADIIRERFDIPVVFLTGYADEETIVRAKVTTAFGFVIKPFREPELRAAIEVALHTHANDRKLAEERARREVAEESRLMIESVEDYAIFRLDPTGRVASWNKGAQRLSGYHSDDILGRRFSVFFTGAEREPDRCSRLLNQAADRGSVEYEGWLMRSDGSRCWANVIITALRDEPDQLRGFAVIVRDIGERMEYERALRESQQALRQADRLKDEFIAMLSHELRNPLAAIRSASELMKLETGRGQTRHDRSLAILERQTAHMAKLIDGLLDVSALVGGEIELQTEPVELGALLRETLQDRTGQLEARDLELHTEIDDAPMWVEGERVRLTQVFDNLLSNAIRFTQHPGTITITAGREGDQVVVEVRDTGSGIAADLLPFIFEPFRQAAQSLARASGGLGLGLALVRGVVELHGGSVEARSAGKDRGSEFTVRLPLTDQPGRQPYGAEPEGGRVRLLIVEDNLDAAELLRELLETWGHEVAVAHDGERAVELAADFQPDVVLCDIGLPGDMDGYDVARALRRQPTTARSTLVALTGYGRAEDIRQARQAGFDAHLIKPVDMAAVDELVSGYRHA